MHFQTEVMVMATIYIVEDDDRIREIETIALSNSGHEVFAFENAGDFYVKLEERIPDMVLLDIMLPDEDGNSILKCLRAEQATKDIPVIMVTAKDTELDMLRSLENGADDYVRKPFSVMELITRVKVVLRRCEVSEDTLIISDEICIDSARHKCSISGTEIQLTLKEFKLLEFIMKNHGIVLSRKQIMMTVWGTGFESESRTVDMHIKTLRQKLGESGNHIQTIRNVGYVFK